MPPRLGLPPQGQTPDASPSSSAKAAHSLVEQRQIVLPLIYEEGVLGLLVTRRDDRAWEEWEHHQIEAIAQSLALACVMDQRYLWGQREREQERLVHLQQHDLMDNLLHQFRNSLTALQTFSKLILRRFTPGDRSHELAANISYEANRLRDLAQQMEWTLDATVPQGAHTLPAATPSREEEQLGDATLEPHPIPLLPATGALSSQQLPLERCLVEMILEPLLASAQAIATEKQIILHSDLSEDLPPVWANPAALREALNNLLENAIKYTPPGGQIWVNAEAPETSSHLEIAVSDTGCGIPAADLPRIFERHYRGIQATGDIPGSGLGLAITRSLIEQMHGKIQVFSPALETKRQTPGLLIPLSSGGTTFRVELPLAMGSEESETDAT
jgi:signal transduction histidine kinase